MLPMSRRAWLARVAGSTTALASGMLYMREALAQGEIKTGISRLSGDVRLNGKPTQVGAQVRLGDVIETGRGNTVVVMDRDAFMIRADTRFEVGGGSSKRAADTFGVLAGKVLSVFVPGKRATVVTATATMGIRGTGVYVECIPDCTYACTCYGSVELNPLADPKQAVTVTTTYHDSPRYVFASADKSIRGPLIEEAPVVNHTDAELMLLEGLVGRKVPFVGGRY